MILIILFDLCNRQFNLEAAAQAWPAIDHQFSTERLNAIFDIAEAQASFGKRF
jgi:hypothetical protein